MGLEICGRIKTLIRPDSPDRWTDQIRHIDMYQTRQDNSHVQVLSDSCGDVGGNGQVNGWFHGALIRYMQKHHRQSTRAHQTSMCELKSAVKTT